MKHLLLLVMFVILPCLKVLAIGQHPYLFFTNDRIKVLREKLETDKQTKSYFSEIKSIADKALKEENPHLKLDYLALVYQITGDCKYADKIKETILFLGSKTSLEPQEMLNREPAWTSSLSTAKANFQMSIGYDAIYNDLQLEERKELAQAIYHIGIRPTWNDWVSPETRFHAINSMGHNYWVSCIGMMGIAAMAVMDEIPEASFYLEKALEAVTDWSTFSGDIYQNKPANLDNGAYYESVSYANFGLQEYLFFRLALQNFDTKIEWPERAKVVNMANFFLHTCYPSDGSYLPSLYFGDGSIESNGEAVVKLLWALGIQKPDMLWYLSQVRINQKKESMPINTPMGILYSPDLSDMPVTPSLPHSNVYEKMGWATMRTSWEKNSTLLGIKCGHTWNHAHADAGSFILFHNGKQVIKDGGNCWYRNPWYRNYFFQSQAHNVLLFDGKAQPEEQQHKGSQFDGSLHHLIDEGNIKYIMANATGPTSHYFAKNHRHYLWIDDVILIIDDARTYEYGTFSLLFHPDGDSRKTGIDISVVNDNAAVNIRPLWPEYLTENDFEHDWPDNLKIASHQGPIAKLVGTDVPEAYNAMETYYSVSTPNKAKTIKFITAIVLKDSPESKDYPQVTRLKANKELIAVRISHKNKITDVYLNTLADGSLMHLNSTTNINGWDTDAYLLAYSYEKGTNPMLSQNIKEWFVAYGSYVRKGQEMILDSYAKKTLVIRK